MSYVESVIDIDFEFSTTDSDITMSYVADGALDPYDAYATWVGYQHGTIQMEASYIDHGRLFLHELGHIIGLRDHRSGTAEETVMTPTVYRGDVEFGTMDLIDLWAIWGVSEQYLGDIHGDARDNTLLGGTDLFDADDNGETLYGKGGHDTIYGNGGDDIIYGGTGLVDPFDGNDIIYGGAGYDVIYGNGGDDIIYDTTGIIYGGAGADTFYVASADQVMDYQAIDTIIIM